MLSCFKVNEMFLQACENNDNILIHDLIEKIDLNENINPYIKVGEFCLYCASKNGNILLVKYIVKNIKLCDRLDNTKDLYLRFKEGSRSKSWATRYARETINIIKELEEKRSLSKTQKVIIFMIKEKILPRFYIPLNQN